jgi:hypothetical protein
VRLFSTMRPALNHRSYAKCRTPGNLSASRRFMTAQRIAPNASAISAKSNGGFYGSMDAWGRGRDADLRFFFGDAG